MENHVFYCPERSEWQTITLLRYNAPMQLPILDLSRRRLDHVALSSPGVRPTTPPSVSRAVPSPLPHMAGLSSPVWLGQQDDGDAQQDPERVLRRRTERGLCRV